MYCGLYGLYFCIFAGMLCICVCMDFTKSYYLRICVVIYGFEYIYLYLWSSFYMCIYVCQFASARVPFFYWFTIYRCLQSWCLYMHAFLFIRIYFTPIYVLERLELLTRTLMKDHECKAILSINQNQAEAATEDHLFQNWTCIDVMPCACKIAYAWLRATTLMNIHEFLLLKVNGEFISRMRQMIH